MSAQKMGRRPKPKPEAEDGPKGRIHICEADLLPPRRGGKRLPTGHVWDCDPEGVIID